LFAFSTSTKRARRARAAPRWGGRHTGRPPHLRCRPALEPLENRLTPSVSGPPFDFSNSFYLANGIDPSKIIDRVGGPTSASSFVVDNSNTNPDRNNIRITEMTGGFNHEG